MKKTAMKNTLRMIRRTRSRFITLMAIIAIGIAFFMGVYSSSTIMDRSVDRYDDDCHLKDITIYSGYGFSAEDLDAIRQMKGVKKVEGKKFADVIASDGNDSYITRVHSYDPDDTINSFVLKEGRLPEKDNEALAEYSTGDVSYFRIGDTIRLSRPEDDLDTYLSQNEVVITGLVQTPLYLDHSRESSTLSNRSIETFLYVNEDAFAIENDMEADILTEKGARYDAFSDEYHDYVDTVKKRLEKLAASRQEDTYNEIKEKAMASCQDGLNEYKTQSSDFEIKISEGENTLNEKQNEINAGWEEIAASGRQLKDSETGLNSTEKTKTAELDTAEKQINAGLLQIEEGKKNMTSLSLQCTDLLSRQEALVESEMNCSALQAALSQIASTSVLSDVLAEDSPYRQSLNDLDPDWQDKTAGEIQQSAVTKQNEIQAGIAQIDAGLASIRENLSAYDNDAITSINETEASLDTYIEKNDRDGLGAAFDTLNEQYTGLCSMALSQLESQKNELNQKLAEVNNGREELKASIEEGREQIEEGKQKLAGSSAALRQGQKEIDQARSELESQKMEGQEKLAEAYQKLTDARAEIDAMEENEWTVLTRKQHYASASYEASVDQMAAIGFLFPIFFILVAALVCMTTMSRTVSEERGEIGILRALGYSRSDCMKKYLLYALIACVSGEVGGVIVGMAVFPAVVYSTWKLMYTLPDMVLAMDWKLYFLMDVVFLSVMLVTTAIAAGSEMKEVPAQLLRPKAPKAGKRMFLERFPSLWKKISFSWKVTIRNIVRDPKRFWMTIAGVAGCTALLVTGFGVRDSLSGMVNIQYDEIYQYQIRAQVSSLLTGREVKTLAEKIGKMDGVKGVEIIHGFSSSAQENDGTEHSFNVELFEDDAAMKQAVRPRTRVGHQALSIEDGAVIDEKLAEMLGLSAGDTMTLQDEEGTSMKVRVAGITEMYIGHACFMRESTYEKAAGKKASEVWLLLKSKDDTDHLKDTLMQEKDLVSLTFADSERASFDTMIASIGLIIVVIILASMTLAFVVLGNLIDVNIAEREREIATLKVLGFRKKEVENYIFRENNVLTLFGAVCGIPLGIALHHQIMKMVETEQMMLGRTVKPLSMVISVCLTVGFGILVNLFMRSRIHRVQMVESLKSVE